MADGTIEIPSKPILKETKKTWYRLHPDTKLHFGEVMECPNLPVKAIAVKRGEPMSLSEYYREKGFKENPQDLMPQAKLVYHEDGIFLIPEGYEIKDGHPPVEDENGKVVKGGYWTRVVPRKDTEENPSGVTCDVCGKVCKDDFGLKAHKRGHK